MQRRQLVPHEARQNIRDDGAPAPEHGLDNVQRIRHRQDRLSDGTVRGDRWGRTTAVEAGTAPATWSTASTLAQLGELTAQWLTGMLLEHPCSETIPDHRAAPLIGLIAAVNRGGLLTDFAQPGWPDHGDGCVQRAAVTGYCSEAVCRRFVDAVAPTDLVILAEHRVSSVQIPVTIEQDVISTWVGGLPSTERWDAVLPVGGLAALATSSYVSILDPVWGRNDRLWQIMAAALNLPGELAVRASTAVMTASTAVEEV